MTNSEVAKEGINSKGTIPWVEPSGAGSKRHKFPFAKQNQRVHKEVQLAG